MIRIFIIIYYIFFFTNIATAEIKTDIALKVNDKIITSFDIKNKILSELLIAKLELNQNNINTPKTYVSRGQESASKFIRNFSFDSSLIYKPLFGSQGDNIRLIRGSDDFDQIDNATNIYYFQEYLENIPNYDYRVLVINKKDDIKSFYMTRYGETFINNVSKGATCTRENLDDEVIEIAIKSSRLLNIDFCGVDIISHKGKYYVIEVNSIPAWRGLQEVESTQISDHIAGLLQ